MRSRKVPGKASETPVINAITVLASRITEIARTPSRVLKNLD
jgi:hypothetical protein